MSAHPYVVTFKQPGSTRPLFHYTVARSPLQAEKSARRFHKGWRVISVELEFKGGEKK